MSEMVERVARSIYDGYAWAEDWEDAGYGQKYAHRCAAKAAIVSLREPTEAMIEAGAPFTEWTENTQDCWRAMIDAALANTPETENSHVVRTFPKFNVPSTR